MEEQLNELRSRWVEAKKKGDTCEMKLIEIRAKLLKMGAKPLSPSEQDINEKIALFL